MNVYETIPYRRSARGFLDKSVDTLAIKGLICKASRAPLPEISKNQP